MCGREDALRPALGRQGPTRHAAPSVGGGSTEAQLTLNLPRVLKRVYFSELAPSFPRVRGLAHAGRKRRVSVPGPPPAVGTGGPWPGVADPLASTSTFHAAQVLFYNVNRLTSILGSEARRPLLRKTRSPVSFAMAADFLVKAPGDSPRPAAGAFAGKQAVHHFCGLAGTFPSGVGLGSTEAKSGG